MRKISKILAVVGIHVQSLVQMACDSRLLDLESRNRALQTIATNVEEALHVKHQVVRVALLLNLHKHWEIFYAQNIT